ncbi:PDDEXK nuclease domain-containing protein [Parasediminibacterium sp. JCM 36343]|uniref:PDDEXK nuclease domain-containing protein n=1 Tax=Parasediminibacterium sp. JCM 36343 TaxID=3374279 RepID=UPI00397CB1CD
MSFEISKDYPAILNNLKETIRQARMQATIAVNNILLIVYWQIGNTITNQEKAEGWGTKTVEKLAIDLKAEFPDMNGLSPRNLRYMRDFALAYPQFSILQRSVAKLKEADNQPFIILQRSVAKLPWGHNCTLLDRVKLPEERLFYVQKTLQNGWTRDMMINQIESNLYKRLGSLSNNFKTALPAYDSELAIQLFKDSYHLDFFMLSEEAKEKDLESALMTHITKLLLELGDGFALMGRQKKFEVSGKEFFIDLLFYHTKLRRHILIELKIGEFEPEFVSKMNLYLGLADDQLKSEYDQPAIGLILCKTNNKIIAEYALRDTSKPIGIAEYKIAQMLPDDIKGELPSIEDIEERMDKELKEQETPINARLKAIKQKLKNIQTEEIQIPVNYAILHNLFFNEVKSLYKVIIKKLTEFNEDFLSHSINWQCSNKNFNTYEQLDEFWAVEKNIIGLRDFIFSYSFDGFKKAGTEHFNEWVQLKLTIDTYYYGFVLINHNNQQPFLKKLYHQTLTESDKQQIINSIMTQLMDSIEWKIEKITNSKEAL